MCNLFPLLPASLRSLSHSSRFYDCAHFPFLFVVLQSGAAPQPCTASRKYLNRHKRSIASELESPFHFICHTGGRAREWVRLGSPSLPCLASPAFNDRPRSARTLSSPKTAELPLPIFNYAFSGKQARSLALCRGHRKENWRSASRQF